MYTNFLRSSEIEISKNIKEISAFLLKVKHGQARFTGDVKSFFVFKNSEQSEADVKRVRGIMKN